MSRDSFSPPELTTSDWRQGLGKVGFGITLLSAFSGAFTVWKGYGSIGFFLPLGLFFFVPSFWIGFWAAKTKNAPKISIVMVVTLAALGGGGGTAAIGIHLLSKEKHSSTRVNAQAAMAGRAASYDPRPDGCPVLAPTPDGQSIAFAEPRPQGHVTASITGFSGTAALAVGSTATIVFSKPGEGGFWRLATVHNLAKGWTAPSEALVGSAAPPRYDGCLAVVVTDPAQQKLLDAMFEGDEFSDVIPGGLFGDAFTVTVLQP